MSDASKRPALGAVYALGGALLFGINGSVAKVVMAAGVTAPQLTFMRGLSTVILAGVVLLFTAREQFRISRRDMLGLALLGVAGLAMIQWLYSVAIAILPVGIALGTAAVAEGIPCITTVQGLAAAVQGIEAQIEGRIGVTSLQDWAGRLSRSDR